MEKLAPETKKLIEFLKTCYEQKINATYRVLEEIVPNVRTLKRCYLSSALNIVKNEYGYLFKCLRNIGYLPIENNGKVYEIDKFRTAKIRSQVKRFDNDLKCVDYENLSIIEKERFRAAELKVSAHQMITDPRLDITYQVAGAKCVNSGKLEFDLGNFHDAFKALKMS